MVWLSNKEFRKFKKGNYKGKKISPLFYHKLAKIKNDRRGELFVSKNGRYFHLPKARNDKNLGENGFFEEGESFKVCEMKLYNLKGMEHEHKTLWWL